MRTKLYFMITLLAFLELTALPNSFAQGPLAQPSVRLVYFLPSDRPDRPDRIEALQQLIKDAQEFYADEMERHGYGRKTFRVETDTDGTPVVHRVNGKFNENYYYTGVSDFKIWEEVYEHFDELEHIYFVAIDLSYETLNDGSSCGLGSIGFLPMGGDANFSVGKIAIRHRSETSGEEGLGGSAIIPASGPCFFDDQSDHNHPLRTTTHELGHAFGLEHDFRSGKGWDINKTVMGGSAFHLSSSAAEWLSVNCFFNTKLTQRNKSGEIQLLSIRAYNKDTISLRFKVVDPDGLHQTQLLIPHILNGTGWGPYRLFDCKRLNGKTSTIESSVRAAEIVDRVTLQIIDVNGNVTWATFPIQLDEVVPTRNFLDVNSDGLVNLSDLTLIASRYGQPGKSPTDVNEDGIVNIVDMLLVAGRLSALPRRVVEAFAAADVQQWLTDAKQLGIENELLKKGVIVLEHLLTEINLPSKSTEVATGSLQTVFEGHMKVVWSVAFSPDGQTLASASWDKTIRLWNLHTQQLETTLIGHTADIMSVTFSPDEETLASAGWDQTILFWNVQTGELIGRIEEHSDGIESVLFSPDGETLASASADRTIRLWNVRTRQLERRLTWTARIRSIAFSPNGGMLASSSADTTVHLWNPRTGKHIRTLRGHTGWVNKVMFSSDGQTLVSSSSDGTVRLWNPANGKPKRTLTNQHGWTKPLAFSSDSEKLLIGGGNRISVWNTQTGQYEPPLAENINDTTSLALSPDGQMVATGSDDNKVRLWEFTSDAVEDRDKISISEIMVASNGGSLPQWIELYNASDTHAVNLKGWRLEVQNRRSTNFNGHINTALTLKEKVIKPQKTLLIISKRGQASNHFRKEQIYDLNTLHPNLQDMVLSEEGFYLKLSNKTGKRIDEVGNLDGKSNTDDKPAWHLPRSTTKDGVRTSMIRRQNNGTSLFGTEASSWISAVNTNLATSTTTYYGHPDDIGAPGIESGGAVPVQLSRFRAELTDAGIVLRWTTESELDNAGFCILRSEKKKGKFKRVNPALIQGAGTTSERHTYTWKDTTAKPNVVYYYRIEDISHAGVRKQLATVRMRGYVSAAGKLTTKWGDLKLQE